MSERSRLKQILFPFRYGSKAGGESYTEAEIIEKARALGILERAQALGLLADHSADYAEAIKLLREAIAYVHEYTDPDRSPGTRRQAESLAVRIQAALNKGRWVK